jgi:hypothetical protein
VIVLRSSPHPSQSLGELPLSAEAKPILYVVSQTTTLCLRKLRHLHASRIRSYAGNRPRVGLAIRASLAELPIGFFAIRVCHARLRSDRGALYHGCDKRSLRRERQGHFWLTFCTCTPDQRSHPAHSAMHDALDELVADGTLEIIRVDDERRPVYRKRSSSDLPIDFHLVSLTSWSNNGCTRS